MAIETYSQALDFWYARVNYEQRGMPADLHDLKLDRIRRLLELLAHPEKSFRIVHVAGSKGKGSTSAMLAQVLQRAGYRVGLFTSPHLTRVEERVQVDGQPITAEELTALMRELEPAVCRVETEQGAAPTFFEIATALGFLHYARRRVDVAVVEIGLGGRFDSTNICLPLLAVITSISFDHTQQLGNTLASIAREKAGIIKPQRPTVCGATAQEAARVIEEVARTQQSPLQVLNRDFKYTYTPGRATATESLPPRVQVETRRRRWPTFELALHGPHQGANAAVVMACVEQLRSKGLHIADDAVAAGLRETRWPARIEVVGREPDIVLDCAHNVASIQSLLETLRTTFTSTRRVLIFAGSRDKDLPGMLALLVPQVDLAIFTRYSSSLRGAAAEELAAIWRAVGGGAAEVHATPAEALARARRWASPRDLVCITGSVFLAGELRPLLVHG